MKTYGNITFGKQGLEMLVKYNNPESSNPMYTQENITEALKCAKDYIKGRMKHCLTQLNQNAYKATLVTENEVAWEGGHFVRSVYDEMEKIDLVDSWDQLTVLQLQQIIRALHSNSRLSDKYWGNTTEKAFNIATEYLLCAAINIKAY